MSAVSAKPPGRPPKDRLLGLAELRTIVCLSKSMLYAEIAAGRFPRPVKVGRSAFWRLSEVEVWIQGLRPASFTQPRRQPAGEAPKGDISGHMQLRTEP